MAFTPASLVVACLNNALYIYNVPSRKFTSWSLAHPPSSFPVDVTSRGSVPLGIAFNPAQSDQFLVWSRFCAVLVDLDRGVPKEVFITGGEEGWGGRRREKRREKDVNNISEDEGEGKDSGKDSSRKRKSRGGKDDPSASMNFSVIEKYSNLIHLSFVGPNELVVVEHPWSSKHLPDVRDRKVYGN